MPKEVRIPWSDSKAAIDTNSGFNIFADLVLAILPAVVISSLNLKRKIKVGLVILMSLGVL